MNLRLLPRRIAAALALLAAVACCQAQPVPDTRSVAVGDRNSPLTAGWDRGVFMEIFVRAWKDSDGDGIGDLKGLTQTLDYMKVLGVRGIWLMPITSSADHDHGYHTTDFRAIAPEYGTLADFDELIRQAHRRGIGVIMDYVVNHSAVEHPFFQSALKGPESPFRDWYVWADEAPQGWDIWGKNPWYHTASEPWAFKGPVKDLPAPPPDARGFYFGTFNPTIPDFNLRNPAVVAFHEDSLRFWLNRGLDGFRLDAVPHLIENGARDWNDQPESRALTKRLQDLIKSYDRRAVVCEATADPQAYGDPQVCGGAFAFGYVQHIARAARGDPESAKQVAEYYRQARPTMATFVSNHDAFAGRRLWDQVDGDERQYKLAAATYLLQPGTPYIYYGEEIGQAGVPGLEGDLPLRSPMSWSADRPGGGFTKGRPFRPLAPNLASHNAERQRRDPGSIFNFYKSMIGLRNSLPSIAQGSYEQSFAQGLVVGWQRSLGHERTVVVINYGNQVAPVAINALGRGARLVSAWPAGGAQAARADSSGTARLMLAPQSVRVLVVRP
jgi:alpha-amylase